MSYIAPQFNHLFETILQMQLARGSVSPYSTLVHIDRLSRDIWRYKLSIHNYIPDITAIRSIIEIGMHKNVYYNCFSSTYNICYNRNSFTEKLLRFNSAFRNSK